jgi:hypothetical protein
MKKLILALAMCGAATLASCDDVRQPQTETAPPAVEEAPVAPAATDNAAPAAETAAPPKPATDNSALPPDQRPSEDTVKPESETLFY